MSDRAGDDWWPGSELLFAAALRIDPPDDGRWLLLGCQPALAVALATALPRTRLRWAPTDIRALTALHHTLARDDLANVERDVDPVAPVGPGEAFDAVLVHAPPERALARRWLVAAQGALRAGGALLVAGANAAGVRSVLADAAALVGQAVASDYRRRHRIARFIQPDEPAAAPEWAVRPGIAPGSWESTAVEVGGERFQLDSLPGVFAGGRLDAGTALLLDHLRVTPGERVLDVGCGSGVVGLLAARRGAGWVDLVDANLLAVAAAARNLACNGIANGRALVSDVYDAVEGERYNLVVSNPPFHRGKSVDDAVAQHLIAEAPAVLARGGRLLLVANAFLPYDHAMRRVFAQVETVAATRQYRVLLGARAR